MANYPSSVSVFTTKVDDQTIEGSHVNDLQTEVVALEDALLTTGLAHTLKFVDNTYDIGATSTTFRPRDFFLSRNATISGTLTQTGVATFAAVPVFSAGLGAISGTTLTLTGNVLSNLLFTDATYDIGATGATRPRDLFLSRNATIGGTLAVTGVATLSASTIGLRGVTYTLPSADGAASTFLQTNGSGTLSWASAGATAGQVIQVVAGSTTTTASSSSSTYVDSNVTATITPAATANKVLVLVNMNGLEKDTNNTFPDFKLLRGATSIAVASARSDGLASTEGVGGVSFSVLDSPVTTSATTYKVQFASHANNASVSCQFDNDTSTIVLMEVKG